MARVVACLALGGLGVASQLGASTRQRTPLPAEDLPAERRDGGFVSSAACLECHADEHASWHDSYHRTMTQLATPEAVLGRFDGTVIDSDGVDYRVFERDGEFWVEMPDPDQVMDQVQMRGRRERIRSIPLVERRVLMTTGSHHYQTYWVAGDDQYGRLLQTVPLVYLPEREASGDSTGGRWIPRELAFMRPPGDRFLTQWNHHCIKCHSTGGVPGLVNDGKRGKFDTRVAELGIACEACHGPGEEHVAFHGGALAEDVAALRDADGGDPTIVNPARLDNRRSSQVCGQCHGVFIAADAERGMEFATSGESYRPGDDLHETRYYIQHPAHDDAVERKQDFAKNRPFFRQRWWDDGSILAGGREYTAMMNSVCFLEGDMSCLSCHSMHNSEPEDQLTRGLADNQMCTQCHGGAEYTTDVATHTHHAPDSTGSDCLNCHMPYNSYALFSGVRSHQMGSPAVAASLQHGTPNACNLCHLDRTLDWAQQHTHQWYGHAIVEPDHEQRAVAAGILWMLKGDAAQRAIAAWHAGWRPAQEASGAAWTGLYLARLLSDPYSVVRRIAWKTLRKTPGYESLDYDFIAGDEQLKQSAEQAIVRWAKRQLATVEPTAELLFTAAGQLDTKRFDRLYRERDNRPVTIKE